MSRVEQALRRIVADLAEARLRDLAGCGYAVVAAVQQRAAERLATVLAARGEALQLLEDLVLPVARTAQAERLRRAISPP